MGLWNLITNLEVARRGPALVLQKAARAQGICIAMGAPKLFAIGGTKDVMTGFKAYYSLDARDAVY